MNRKKFVGWIVVATLLLAACGGESDSTGSGDEEGPVTIAMTTWLSGSYASFGEGLKLGAELAAKELNDNGGILGGREVQLKYYDEGYNSETITASAKNAVNDGAAVIVGGWDATTCPALAQQGKIAEVAIVITSCGSSDPVLTIDHPALVHTTPPYTSDEYENNVVSINLDYWLERNVETAIGVAGDSAYSILFDDEIEEPAEASEIEWLGNIYFPFGESNARVELTKAVGQQPDLVYLLMGGHELIVNSISTLRELDFPGVIMTNVISTTDAEIETLGDKGDGVVTSTFWVADPSIPESMEFAKQYNELHDTQPDAFTEQAYESVMIAGLALDDAGSTSDLEKINDAFHSLDWITPRGAPTVFDSNGRMLFDDYYILEGRDGKLVLVDTVPFTYGR